MLKILQVSQMNLMIFFVNVASKVKEPVTNTNHVKLKEFCQAKLPADAKFVLPSIQKEKILKFL